MSEDYFLSDSDSDDEILENSAALTFSMIISNIVSKLRSPPINKFVIEEGRGFTFFMKALEYPELFRSEYRMYPSTYYALRNKLKPHYRPKTRLDFDSAFALFLSFVSHNTSYRKLRYDFQASVAVIFTVIEQFLVLTVDIMWHEFVGMPEVSFEMARAQRLRITNPRLRKLYEVFDGAIALVDGTVINCAFHGQNVNMRNYSEGWAVNMVIVTDLMGRFRAVGPGLGAEHDASIFRFRAASVNIPEDTYLLADRGFGLAERVMTGQKGTRFHVDLFTRGYKAPKSPKELYNRVHSSIRMYIERAFGQLKETFPVLRYGRMSVTKLFLTVCSLICIHNFIRETEGELQYDVVFSDEDLYDTLPSFDMTEEKLTMNPDFLPSDINTTTHKRAVLKRKAIEEKLWRVYQSITR